jgi:hypothetical protein
MAMAASAGTLGSVGLVWDVSLVRNGGFGLLGIILTSMNISGKKRRQK